MASTTSLTMRYSRRPLLMLPSAAQEIVDHLRDSDARSVRSEGGFEAFLRVVGLGRRPSEDGGAATDIGAGGEGGASVPAAVPTSMAYSPFWVVQSYGQSINSDPYWSLINGIALIEVRGALSDRGEWYCGEFYPGYDTILYAITSAMSDDRVQGIFVKWYSPGGVVAGGLYDVSEYIRDNRAAAGGKPIHMYVEMGCSAAYHMLSQGDFISASSVALVMNIGAVIVHQDRSEANAKAGVKVTPIQFGASKTDGADWGPLSEKALGDLQAEIDQVGRKFVAAVVAGRPNLTADDVIATQAAAYMAEHDEPERSGVALGFIDAIESEQAAFERLLAVVSTPTAAPSTSQQTKEKTAMFKSKQQKAASKIDVKADKQPKKAESSSEETSEGDDPETEDENGTSVDEQPDDDDDDSDVEQRGDTAAAIALSPEAKLHPKLALAAISSGQTLAQFQASASVISAEGANGQAKTSPLRDAMAGVKRVGADDDKKAESLGSSLVSSAKTFRRK